jgi:hypothetical protein
MAFNPDHQKKTEASRKLTAEQKELIALRIIDSGIFLCFTQGSFDVYDGIPNQRRLTPIKKCYELTVNFDTVDSDGNGQYPISGFFQDDNGQYCFYKVSQDGIVTNTELKKNDRN